MNTLLFTTDRNTHIKIVVVALVAAIAVAAIGINAHLAETTQLSLPSRALASANETPGMAKVMVRKAEQRPAGGVIMVE